MVVFIMYVSCNSQHEEQVCGPLSSATVEVTKGGGVRYMVGHLAWPEEVSQQYSMPTLLPHCTPAAYNMYTWMHAWTSIKSAYYILYAPGG